MPDPPQGSQHGLYGLDTSKGPLCLCGETFATSADLDDHVREHEPAPIAEGADFEAFAADVVATARANVNDCRLDYVEVQLDKDEIDALARDLGLPPIDWHPEPCKHEGTRWVQ